MIHKIGVTLTIVFAILGFWDVRGFFDGDMFREVGIPILGLIAIVGGLKLALTRA